MNAEDLEMTEGEGPRCARVRDLIVHLLRTHPLVTHVGAITKFPNEAALVLEIGGIDFEVIVEPA